MATGFQTSEVAPLGVVVQPQLEGLRIRCRWISFWTVGDAVGDLE